MWTNTQWGVKGQWNPNNLVPVTFTLSTDHMFQPAYHSSPIHAKIKVKSTMDASTVKEESLSEEPEHEPSVIDTSMQYQNTEQSVNDDPSETLQQTHNTEKSISDNPDEPRQELTRAQGVQYLPGPNFLAARDIFQKITEKEHIFENCPSGDKSNCWFLMDNGDNTNTNDRKRSYNDDCGVWDSSKGRCHDQLII